MEAVWTWTLQLQQQQQRVRFLPWLESWERKKWKEKGGQGWISSVYLIHSCF